jgi:hypothetical protein
MLFVAGKAHRLWYSMATAAEVFEVADMLAW